MKTPLGKIRLLIASTEDYAREEVIFTYNASRPAESFFESIFEINADTLIDNNLPVMFPTECRLIYKEEIISR